MVLMADLTKESKTIDLQRLAAVLESIASIEYAMVFGSAGDGLVQAGSDLDVAVSLARGDAGNIDRLLEIVAKVEPRLWCGDILR